MNSMLNITCQANRNKTHLATTDNVFRSITKRLSVLDSLTLVLQASSPRGYLGDRGLHRSLAVASKLASPHPRRQRHRELSHRRTSAPVDEPPASLVDALTPPATDRRDSSCCHRLTLRGMPPTGMT